MSGQNFNFLDHIKSPADLRGYSPDQLPLIADELRSFILDVVATKPGHLGASLGVVELTVALHYLFNTPDDKLVWDVGHQAYGHKILTGRKDRFSTLRQWNGISGFPVREESEYDTFGTGHASTSLSATIGMAVASSIKGEKDRKHIAVVGDGAITGGMFFEALNQAASLDINVLIVLNDNGISIDKSSGALNDYLFKQRQKKSDIDIESPLFESFGIRVAGPIDGNNLNELLPALERVKAWRGVTLLHVITTKGKGFERAEREQVLFHAPGTFDRVTGTTPEPKNNPGQLPLYQQVFGETLVELAAQQDNIVGITPAMPTGSSLNLMMKAFPKRAFDVDIAEQHALTFAAGLATQGMKPFCVIYSTFLQRAYDQLIHDVALQQLPVVLCVDRAGLVGDDGATHHGAFDLAFLRCIPNVILAAPMDEIELRNLMFTAAKTEKGPFVIRYPRGKALHANWKQSFETIEIGSGRRLRKGRNIAVVSIGHPGNFVVEALNRLEEKGVFVAHYDLRFLKPLDEQLLKEVFQLHTTIVTVEDGVISGGMGSALMEWVQEKGYSNKIVRLGIPDHFIAHGSTALLQAHCGYDAQSIYDIILSITVDL